MAKSETKKNVAADEAGAGRFAYPGLDRVFHEPARLRIMASLITNPNGLLFNELKTACELTDGNLSRHLSLLQESGFVEVFKRFHHNRPQTLCLVTKLGIKRFDEYVAELERVVTDAQHRAAESNETPRDFKAEGWSPA